MSPLNLYQTNKFQLTILQTLLLVAIVTMLPYKKISSLASLLFVIWAVYVNLFKSSNDSSKKTLSTQHYLVILTFIAPSAALLISQFLGNSWSLNAYDGPARLLLCIPLYFALCRSNQRLSDVIPIAFSLGVITTFFYGLTVPQFRDGAELTLFLTGSRYTLSHIDAIIFGNCIAIMTVMSIINNNLRVSWVLRILTLTAFIFGITLVILSQTRASYVIVSCCILLISFAFPEKLSYKSILVKILLILLFFSLTYLLVKNIQSRVDAAFGEVYLWLSGVGSETSVGGRLSMWFLSMELFLQNPWVGYGDKNFPTAFLHDMNLIKTYGQLAVETIYCCGPHNEFFANLLRSGVWGAMAYFVTYGLPAIIFLCHLNQTNKKSDTAKLGLILIISFFLGGIFSEMLSLKFMYTFFALILTVLLAEITHEKK